MPDSSDSPDSPADTEDVFAIFQHKAERDADDEIYARYEYVTSYVPDRTLVNVHIAELIFRPYSSNAMEKLFSSEQRKQLKEWKHDSLEAKSAKNEGNIEKSNAIKKSIKNADNADVDVIPFSEQEEYLKYGSGSESSFDADYDTNTVKLLDSSNVTFREDDVYYTQADGYLNKVLPVPLMHYFQHLDKWQLFQEFKLWIWLDFPKELQDEDDKGKSHAEDLAGGSGCPCVCSSFCCFSCDKILK